MVLVAELAETERLALHAYFFDQQSPTDAAESLGMSRSGFYAAVQKALAKLAMKVGRLDRIRPRSK
jgi:DNA-directed RNA polymerase specialized sigma subunit